MTIQFFDSAAQAQYREDVDAYQQKVRELSTSQGSTVEKWPSFPEPPKPLFDSANPDSVGSSSLLAASGPAARDPQYNAPTPADGDACHTPKGFETSQAKTFTLKK